MLYLGGSDLGGDTAFDCCGEAGEKAARSWAAVVPLWNCTFGASFEGGLPWGGSIGDTIVGRGGPSVYMVGGDMMGDVVNGRRVRY